MQPVQCVSAHPALLDHLAKLILMNVHQTLVKMEEFVQIALIPLHVSVNLDSLEEAVKLTLTIAHQTLAKMEEAAWMD